VTSSLLALVIVVMSFLPGCSSPDHRGLDGDREARPQAIGAAPVRAGAQRRMEAEKLSCLARNGRVRERRGRKCPRPPLRQDDRGAAVLPSDRAIERPHRSCQTAQGRDVADTDGARGGGHGAKEVEKSIASRSGRDCQRVQIGASETREDEAMLPLLRMSVPALYVRITS
jgi:hypothetical protein